MTANHLTQPTTYTIMQTEPIIQIIIRTQYREWYGDEAHVGVYAKGRFKSKGGLDFVMSVPQSTLFYKEDEIRDAFHAVYNKPDCIGRCDIIDIDIYHEPERIALESLMSDQPNPEPKAMSSWDAKGDDWYL